MNERRKIIIPTGVSPEESLPTPHFDVEATLTARPVVPLSEQETSQMQYGGYSGRAATPFWKRPALLALVVLSAVGIGVAAGLAIGIYKSRQNAQAPIVSVPPSENPKVAQTVEQPAPTPISPIPRATVPEQTVETPAEPKDEERERTARNERKDKDEQEVTPPVVRDKKRDKKTDDDDDQVLDDRQAEKERRRDERRERRRRQRDEEAIDVPRGIERAGKEINRIREIFEGRQP